MFIALVDEIEYYGPVHDKTIHTWYILQTLEKNEETNTSWEGKGAHWRMEICLCLNLICPLRAFVLQEPLLCDSRSLTKLLQWSKHLDVSVQLPWALLCLCVIAVFGTNAKRQKAMDMHPKWLSWLDSNINSCLCRERPLITRKHFLHFYCGWQPDREHGTHLGYVSYEVIYSCFRWM